MSCLENNKRIVLECLKAFGSGDRDLLRIYIADDASIWVPDGIRSSGTFTPDSYLQIISDNVAPIAAGEARMEIISTTAENDRVSLEAESHMELKNGKIYNNKYHFLFKIKGGVIVEMKEYMNTQHTLETIDSK